MLNLVQVPDHQRTSDPDVANVAGRTPQASAPDVAKVAGRTPQVQRYYAFISYSHKDEAMADWLHCELERFRVPRSLAGRVTVNGVVPRRLTPVFRDEQELPAAADLGAEIRAALASSHFLIVLCSRAAAKSRWINVEIESFKHARPEGCVLAAIIEGEPFANDLPGRKDEECFPPALRYKYDRRGRKTSKRAEPLAADFREGAEGRRLAFLKLVAGMLGVGLDELVQRETTRRQRRLAYFAAASLAGMAVTSTLAITAIQARDAAREQRREAEGLIAFMLGDLKDKLEPIGRLDVLDGVGAKSLAYYEKQDKSKLSDQALAQRARALTLLGEVANSGGDLGGALQRYMEAFASTRELLRREPDNPQRLFDHAQNVFYLSQVAWQRGQTKEAEGAIHEYKALAERMIALDPSNEKYRLERKYANTSLGALLLDLRRYSESVTVFRESLRDIEALASAAPSNTTYQDSRIETIAWLSDALEMSGRLDDALAQRDRQIAFLDPLTSTPNVDATFRVQAMVAHRAAGRLLASRGDASSGREQLEIAVRIGHELMRTDPNNAEWAGWAANAIFDLSELQLAAGQIDEAARTTRVACDIADRLITRDPSVKAWRVGLRSSCITQRTRLAMAHGASEEARALAARLVSLMRAEAAKTDGPDARQAVAGALLLTGMVATTTGDRAGGQEAYREAYAAWPKDVVLTPNWTARQVLILEASNRHSEAQRWEKRLDELGYRHPTYLKDRQFLGRS